MNVNYNAGRRRVCGNYCDSAEQEQDRMSMDLKQFNVRTTDDIDEWHAAHRAKMRKERESGDRTAA